jgi:hypothetical protein
LRLSSLCSFPPRLSSLHPSFLILFAFPSPILALFRICAFVTEQKSLALHHARLRTKKTYINNSPPPVYPHMLYNQKVANVAKLPLLHRSYPYNL